MSWHEFTCEPVERRDAAGLLLERGVVWSEYNPFTGEFRRVFLFIGVLAGLVALAIGATLVSSPKTRFDGAFVLFGGIWLAWIANANLSDPVEGFTRSLVFHRDGLASLPHGLFYWPKVRRLNARHTEIVSVETRSLEDTALPEEYRHGVVIFMKNGDVVEVAMCLRRDCAHKVAVQLSQALQAMREELVDLDATRREYEAKSAAFRQAMRGARAHTVVIE